MAAVMTGCLSPDTAATGSVDCRQWSGQRRVEWINTDSVALRNIYATLLAERNRTIDSLPLSVTFTSPSGKQFATEWTFYPSDNISFRSATFAESRQLLAANAVMNEKGQYIFTFRSRSPNPVEGVWNIGVEVETINR